MGQTAFPMGSQALSSRVLVGAHPPGDGPLDTQTGTPKSQRGPPPPTRWSRGSWEGPRLPDLRSATKAMPGCPSASGQTERWGQVPLLTPGRPQSLGWVPASGQPGAPRGRAWSVH